MKDVQPGWTVAADRGRPAATSSLGAPSAWSRAAARRGLNQQRQVTTASQRIATTQRAPKAEKKPAAKKPTKEELTTEKTTVGKKPKVEKQVPTGKSSGKAGRGWVPAGKSAGKAGRGFGAVLVE
jgi:FtsZ-interacting cell division protein ZipA